MLDAASQLLLSPLIADAVWVPVAAFITRLEEAASLALASALA